MRVTLAEFFALLYKGKSQDEFLTIVSIESGKPRVKFFNTIDDQTVAYVAAQDRIANVYFGVGLLDRELPDGRRGVKENVIALPAFWLDIDVAGPGHKKKNLFKTESDALEVLKKVGLTPSIVVRTGGGLHLYFLFTELWRLTSPDLQEYADRISQGFQSVILREAKMRNAVIDMTGDITRILRCPDSTNKK